jgi:hypothetical protein
MGWCYSSGLAAERLKRCYELAPTAVRRYLDAEVEHVLRHVPPGWRVLFSSSAEAF